MGYGFKQLLWFGIPYIQILVFTIENPVTFFFFFGEKSHLWWYYLCAEKLAKTTLSILGGTDSI